jgi:hypothetical protein
MASIVLIETNGTVKTLKTKELTVDTLYKKCGFRINEDFTCRHTWHVKLAGTEKEKYTISVWAKKTGKAGGENKYDFPPPIDKDLFFGTCAVVRTNAEGDFLDLTKETWLKIYEKLFGGFEDIGDEDEYSEDELENVDPSLLTKNGYLKDGFVVSDKELTSGAPSTEDEEDEVKESVVTVKKKTTKTKKKEDVETKPKETKPVQKQKETKQAKETKQREAKQAQKQTPKQAKQVQAKQVQAKETKQAKQAEPPAKEVSNSESEETTSELEEEVYTFSDDD